MNNEHTILSSPKKTFLAFGLVVLWCLLGAPVPSVQAQNVAQDSCDNVTDPGQIGFDQILCAPGNDPAPIISLRPASGGSGELEYIWMYSEVDSDFNESTFKPIPNSNTETYDPGPLTRTTTFARCARRVGCPNFLEPEVVVITIGDEAKADIIGPMVICYRDTITYVLETHTENPDRIDWSFPTGVSVLENTGKSVTIAFPSFGQYVLRVEVTENGCTAVGTKTIVAVNNPAYCGEENEPVMANFSAQTECGSLDVAFTNTSKGAKTYLWTFIVEMDGSNPTSAEENPTFTFPQSGMYPVQLIAESETGVQDTIWKVVDVGNEFVVADFNYAYLGCTTNQIDVQLTDNSQSSGGITSWDWISTDGQTANTQNPIFTFVEEGIETITLTVETDEGCMDTISKVVMIHFPDILTNNLPDSVVNCPGESFQLHLINNMQYQYMWSPTTGIDNPLSFNPVFSPQVTTTYFLTAGILGTTCVVMDSFTVRVAEELDLTVIDEGNECASQRRLQARTDIPATLVWLNENGDTLATGAEYFPPLDTSFNIVVRATSAEDCVAEQFLFYESSRIDVSLPDTVTFCPEDTPEIFAETMGENIMLRWEPSGIIQPGSTPTSIIIDGTPGTYEVIVTARSAQGCEARDTALVVIIGDDFSLAFTAIPDSCANGTIQFANESTQGYTYFWDFGDPNRNDDTSTLANPVYQYQEAGTYEVSLTLAYGADCIDTFQNEITVEPFAVEADFSSTFQGCTNNGALYLLEDRSVSDEEIIDRYWLVSDGRDTVFGESPQIGFTQTGIYTVTLVVDVLNGCSYQTTKSFDVRIPQIDLQDSLVICNEGTLLRLPQPDDSLFTFSWSPPDGLDDPSSPTPYANPETDTWYQLEVSGTGTNTCSILDSTYVIVTDSIDLFTTPDTLICKDSIRLFASTSFPVLLQWYNENDSLLGTGNTILVFPVGTQTYRVTASQMQGGCYAEKVITVTNGTVDVSVIPEMDTIVACTDDVVSLGVTNNRPEQSLVYNWMPTDFLLSEANISNPDYLVTEEPYTITGQITNNLGCSVEITRYIQPGLFIVNLPDTVVACKGESIELAPESNPDYFYTWTPTENLSESDINNPVFSGDSTTVFTVLVTDTASGLGCTITREVVVVVGDTLDLRPQTELPEQICAGDSLLLEVAVFPDQPDVDVVWYKDAELKDSVGSGFSLWVLVEEGVNIFFAEATNGSACTGLVRYTFLGEKPSCTLPFSETLCPGVPTPIDLGCDPDDLGFLTFTWSSEEDLDLSNPAQPVVTLTAPRLYEVTITDTRGGCVQTGFVELDMYPEGKIDLGSDTSICAAGDFEIIADISGVYPDSIIWYSTEEPDIILGTGSSLTIPVMDTLVIVVEGLTYEGCSLRDSIMISVGDFMVPVSDTIAACPGEPIGINPNGDPDLNYMWSPDDDLDISQPWNPIATLSESITYTVTITDPIRGCTAVDSVYVEIQDSSLLFAGPDIEVCGADSVQLSVTYQCVDNLRWMNASGELIGQGGSIKVLPDEGENTFFVEGTGLSGSILTDTIRVFRTDLRLNLSDTVVVCLPFSTELNPDESGSQYAFRWSPIEGLDDPTAINPIATITADQLFKVTVTDPSTGCTAVDSVYARVQVLPVLDAGPDLTICAGEEVTLRAEIECVGLVNWSDENGNLLGAGSEITVMPGNPIQVYVVSALTNTGEIISDTITVTVIGHPPLLPDMVLVCPDEPTALNPNPDTSFSYSWAPELGLDDPMAANPFVRINQDQIYVVTTTDESGCTFKDTVQVDVRDGLEPDNISPDTSICTAQPILLFAYPDTGSVVEWFADASQNDLLATGTTYMAETEIGANTFYVRVTDTICQKEYLDSIIVTVEDLIVDLPDTVQVCSGVPTPLNPEGEGQGFALVWTPTTGLDDPNAINPLFTGTDDQVFQVYITDPQTECTTTEEVVVRIQRNPTIDAGDDQAVCPQERVTLQAEFTCADQVFWTNVQGNVLVEGPNLELLLDAAGVYLFVAFATTGNGAAATDTVMVTVFEGEAPIFQDTVSVCPDEPGELNPQVVPEYSYSWSPSEYLDDPNSGDPIVTISEDQLFMVTATDENGCEYVDSVFVDVRNGLDPESSSSDTTLCGSELISLTVKVDSGVLVTWFATSALTDTLAQGNTLTTLPGLGDNVYYIQSVDPICNTIFLDSLRVKVIDFSVMVPDTVRICQNEPTPLNPDAEDTELLYNWMPATGLDDPFSANPKATLVRSQTYIVDITDPVSGCVASDTVFVQVQEQPEVDAGEDQTVCAGDSVNLKATVTCAQFVEWLTLDGTSLGIGTEITVFPSDSINVYVVAAISSGGAIATDTVVVTVRGMPPVLAQNISLCPGIAGEINPNPDLGYTYEWMPEEVLDNPEASNPAATIFTETVFFVEATDSTGCVYTDSVTVGVRPEVAIDSISSDTVICAGDTAKLQVVTNPNYKVEWRNSTGELVGEGLEVVIIPESGENHYVVTVSDTICGTTRTDSIRIQVPVFTDAIPVDTIISCGGIPVFLNPGGSEEYTYQWDNEIFLDSTGIANPLASVSQDTWFSVTITDPTGLCTYIDSVFVDVQGLPDIRIPGDTTVCLPGLVVITAASNASMSWVWSDDVSFDTILSSEASLAIEPDQGEQTFYVRGTDEMTGCHAIDSILIIYRPIMATLEQLDVACIDGDQVTVEVINAHTDQNLSYLWNPENLIVGGDPTAGPQVVYLVEGTVVAEVMLSNQFGCNTLLETTIEPLNLNNIIDLVVEDSLLLPDEMTTVTVTGCDDCTYEWFQDSVLLAGENGESIIVAPEETTEIAVVVSKEGCFSDTLRQIIVVNACVPPYVFVPSGFTPNGDGMNDYVRVYGEVILEEDFEFSIVARWGEEVYYSTNKDDIGWDGTYRGRDVPPDTYGYSLQYRCAVDGELYFLKGNITVLR
ncbi:MAG: gliding motility-associated C-terminal domain-containing protein [Saprospiraceae bacterium]|nr:gliding motility-associated C-terminal domain-containing protein [Saprospiraceae bacterium]